MWGLRTPRGAQAIPVGPLKKFATKLSGEKCNINDAKINNTFKIAPEYCQGLPNATVIILALHF